MSTEPTFEFSGGELCLDFVNTLGDRPLCRSEGLQAPGDLLRWAGEAGLVPPAERVGAGAALSGPAGRRVLARAIELRERLYRVFAGISEDRRPDAADLAALNDELVAAMRHLRLVSSDGGFAWAWDDALDTPERILWPVVRSAAELLVSEEAGLIKVCASDRCSWLFVDRSRTHRRRWCSMQSCGNRAKARRHYRRKKLEAAGD